MKLIHIAGITAVGGIYMGTNALPLFQDTTMDKRQEQFGSLEDELLGMHAQDDDDLMAGNVAMENMTTEEIANIEPSGIGSIGEEEYANAAAGDGKVSKTMDGMVGKSTKNVAGTRNGRVACAYAVNDAINRSTGAPALDINNGGLSVASTTAAMDRQPNRFRQVSAQEAISSGKDYVVSSNQNWGSKGSHIGIGSGSTIWSNSSSKGSIQQNYTTNSWNKTFSTAKYYIVE